MDRREAGIPDLPICAGCGAALAEPFAWCSNCAVAFCDACARRHYCLPTCQAAGCIAGLCVRKVSNGQLSNQWPKPPLPEPHL
jgi:hypothetical protein